MNSNSEISRHRSTGSISISSLRNLLPRSGSVKQKLTSNPKLSRFNTENVPPVDPNVQSDESQSILKQSVSSKESIELETKQQTDPHVKV